jgi:hypothetical protein
VIEFIDKPIRARTIREAVPRVITIWHDRGGSAIKPVIGELDDELD